MYMFMKDGTSLLCDPFSIMVMNLPFLLLALMARSANIRSDSSRSIHSSSPGGKS